MKKQFVPLFVGTLMILAGVILMLLVLTSPSEGKTPENDLLLHDSRTDDLKVDNAAKEQSNNGDLDNSVIADNSSYGEQEQSGEQSDNGDLDNGVTTDNSSDGEQEQSDDGSDDPEDLIFDDADDKKMTVDTSLWNLILVNPDHYLPEDFTIETAQVQGNYYLDSRVAPYAIQMIEDAKKDGIELQICSSIRSIELQTRLYNNKIEDIIEEGLSREDAEKKAATIVAVPGTSEHHTGLALDIVTPSYQRLNSGYAQTDAAKWLKNNAAKYGFILRYPEDKTEITKIIFEPWHYRYVGVEYAEFIMSQGICFEEFIALYGTSEINDNE